MNRTLKAKPASEQGEVCVLNVFDAQQTARHQSLLKEIFSVHHETKELRNGYGFQFPRSPSLFLKISEWVSLEHLCCPFFTFNLELQKIGAIWLRITGSQGAKQFLRGVLESNPG